MDYYSGIAFVAPYRIYVLDEFFDVLIGEASARVKTVPLPPTTAGAAQVHGRNVEISHDIFGFGGRTKPA